MNDFASVLDDMYSNTPVTLSDVKDAPDIKSSKTVALDPKLPLYAICIGLALIALVALLILSKRGGAEPVLAEQLRTPTKTVELDAPPLDLKSILKDVKVSEKLTFQISEALVTSEETYEDEKISADREETIVQKYKERMAL